LAEKLGLSGKDVLAAIIVGHEVQARIGLACVPATERGFFSVPVFGNFGAAASAAKLLKKVKLIVPPKSIDADKITIKLKNGKDYSISVKSWKEHYTSPLTTEELLAKFRDATGNTLSPNQAERSIELVLNLDNLKDVTELMKIITFPG